MNTSFTDTLRFLVRWFASGTVRRATELRRQVWRLLNEQRDQLARESIARMEGASLALQGAVRVGTKAEVTQRMSELEELANQLLHPYPHGALRENIKELLVAVTVIFGFTTFFLQLTKIPTNSLVPTLYGITWHDLRNQPDLQIPDRLTRLALYWTKGISYKHVVAKTDGRIEHIDPPKLVFPFVKKRTFYAGGGVPYTIWFPPDRLEDILPRDRFFRAGEDIIKMRLVAGDHLLVDRFTYNFRRPQRGEIFVFKTKGIAGLPKGQLYIKRLVALGGEHVRIGNDHHLIIDGQRLDASTPHFENVYTFSPLPKENQYFGHVNETVAKRYGRRGLAELFRDESTEHVVQPGHYLAMGDNTMNSSDSRTWGDVPQENVIGKCWFVYWPITERFGWGTR